MAFVLVSLYVFLLDAYCNGVVIIIVVVYGVLSIYIPKAIGEETVFNLYIRTPVLQSACWCCCLCFFWVLPESVCSFLLHPFAYLVEPTITKLTKTSTSPKSNTGIEYYTSFCQKFSFFSITVMQLNVENLSDALHDSVYTYIFLNYHLFGRLYIFTDSDGKLKKEIDNEDTSLDKTKYFYKTAEESK